MTATAIRAGRPRLMVPEVVQSSAMDCGPAALKSILEGFRIPVSYGRLREACQTGVDGTSIDAIEAVANRLGIVAEQVMLPPDHLFLKKSAILPALLVVRLATGDTHFVVVWRRHGDRVLVMDPAVGRRWLRIDRLLEDTHRHETSVPAADWRSWAGGEEFATALYAQLAELGASKRKARGLLDAALANTDWFPAAALEASVRLVASLRRAEAVQAGGEAVRLVETLFETTVAHPDDIYTIVPPDLWSVAPDPDSAAYGERHLLLRGAVLLRIDRPHADEGVAVEELPAELAAALSEKPARPFLEMWRLLRADGILAPAALLGVLAIAMAAMGVETLMFRGLLDVGLHLTLAGQRLTAALALLAFMAIALLLRYPIATESMRLGRHLENRLRMALLEKLPRLSDRYFHSRSISDMAERNHSLHLTRTLPGIGIHAVQLVFELVLLLAGIAFIDPRSIWLAAAVAGAACIISALVQPSIGEAELRVRGHAAALGGSYLDSMLGVVPIRVHGAQTAVRRRHEALLLEWLRSSRRLMGRTILAGGAQQLVCVALICCLVWDHFLRAQGISASDLLLVYWSLKLPAVGQSLVAMAVLYPAQRNILNRLMEPLSAPEQGGVGDSARDQKHPPGGMPGIGIDIQDGSVVAAGHTVLQEIDLSIRPGEHIAIVGPSGAGKSSLIGVMLGWHTLASGRLLFDRAIPSASDFNALRRQSAWVDPAIQLWNRSLLDNLAYARRGGDLSGLSEAIDDAQLRRVVRTLPDGQQTLLGEGGAKLSGGEGQRVRLGRSFMQEGVRLALLDEPFRGMDRGQRQELLTQARRRWRHATLLCVTHDIAETQSFDRVLVVDGGRIVEDGPPSKLVASPSSRYRELLDAEMSARDRLWAGEKWRRLHVEDGHVEHRR
jgi:ABC-type bacteriocin/lantibiotic exporter with double-glycine peptidase domain